MAKEKRTPHEVVMTEGKREIIRGLLSEYDIQSAQDIQEALKDLLGGTIKEIMEAENVRKRHDNTPNIRHYRRYRCYRQTTSANRRMAKSSLR